MKFQYNIEVTPQLALKMLCESLNMKFVADEDHQYKVKDGKVYRKEGSDWIYYDGRANLFVALRNVIVNMVPNTYFRSDDYIFNYEEE